MLGVAGGSPISTGAEPGPLHCIQFERDPLVSGVAFSPDGQTAYVLVKDNAINLWEILAYHWPEVGGAAVAVSVVALLFVFWRVARKPQLPGEPHCRRCNYCLKGAVSDRCPECSAPIKRPIVGRTMRRRLVWIAPSVSVVVIVYATLWLSGLSRTGAIRTWLDWWSYDIEKLALDRGINLSSWNRVVDRIYEIDVIGGTIRRTLATRYAASLDFGIVGTPDGEGLILPIAEGERLALVSTRTGAIRRTLRNPVATDADDVWEQVAGFDEESSVAYVVAVDESAARTKLMRWDLKDGASSVVLDLDADTGINSIGRSDVFPHRLYRIPGPRPRFLELKGDRSFDDVKVSAEARVIDLSGGATIPSASFVAPLTPGLAPGFSADGEFAFFGNCDSGFVRVALSTGSTGIVPRSGSPGLTPCNMAHYGRMVLHGYAKRSTGRPMETRFLIADLESGDWIARSGPEVPPLDIWVAPRGQFFAAWSFLSLSNYEKGILFYDTQSNAE